jgi:antitoxin component of RelBE/YafQ-DinJ toxin-antitoxin module
MSTKRKPLSKLVMIRMTEAEHAEVTGVAQNAGLTKSDIVRLAVRNGINGVRRAVASSKAS